MLRRAALTLLLLSTPFLPATGVAVAADNSNDPKTVQTECVRAWNACWDGCKGKADSCYKGCNDKYDICLNVEMEMEAPVNSGSGGAGPKPMGPRGPVGHQVRPGAAVKP